MKTWVQESGVWHLFEGPGVFAASPAKLLQPLAGNKACGIPLGELSDVATGDTPPGHGTWCGGCAEVAVFGHPGRKGIP